MEFKKIPKTTVSTYISGLHSLNLDFEDGTGYDWHFTTYWKSGKDPIKLYGEGTSVNTNHMFGYYGVANREERLQKLGLNVRKVYVANHHRAIIDLVYESLIKYKLIGYAKGCVDDFFYDELNASQLFNHLIKMGGFLDEERSELLHEWLSKEFRSFYRSWKVRTLQGGKGIDNKQYIAEDKFIIPWG